MKRRPWQNWSLILAAGFAVFALLALGLVLSWRSVDQSRIEEGRLANCLAQNESKDVLRTLVLASIRSAEAGQKIDPLRARAELIAEFKRQLPKLRLIPC